MPAKFESTYNTKIYNIFRHKNNLLLNHFTVINKMYCNKIGRVVFIKYNYFIRTALYALGNPYFLINKHTL